MAGPRLTVCSSAVPTGQESHLSADLCLHAAPRPLLTCCLSLWRDACGQLKHYSCNSRCSQAADAPLTFTAEACSHHKAMRHARHMTTAVTAEAACLRPWSSFCAEERPAIRSSCMERAGQSKGESSTLTGCAGAVGDGPCLVQEAAGGGNTPAHAGVGGHGPSVGFQGFESRKASSLRACHLPRNRTQDRASCAG